jgi:hypothetical protein
MVSVIALFMMSCGGSRAAPDIYNFTPSNGLVGTTVTINGSGFDSNADNNIVKFNGTAALVSSATNTEIVTTVPSGATTGKISVSANGQTSTSLSDFMVM